MTFIADIVRAEQLAQQSLLLIGQGHGGHGTDNGATLLPPAQRFAAATAAANEARELIARNFDNPAQKPDDAFLLRNAYGALGKALTGMDHTASHLLMPAMSSVEGAIHALDAAHRRAGDANH